MAMTKVFFSDLKSGRCSFVVESRLLRFWEAKNVKRGGELMWMDLLMVDVNEGGNGSEDDMSGVSSLPTKVIVGNNENEKSPG
ncbi:hypothetical protein HID58_047693 [Brassica napus]|uniref:Uncharacterized protein n=1 Tax=Brassica napus TaxID=3708 RepID=A0ABQ8AZY4_BRANA|nr:hypothetical protein HID58_047693 [Brassica napus]